MNYLHILPFIIYGSVLLEYIYAKMTSPAKAPWRIFSTNVLTGVVTELLFSLKQKYIFSAGLIIAGQFFVVENRSLSLISLLSCIVLMDFLYYIYHRLDHSYKFLWAFHSVHHSDSTLNYSTALRVSWFEQIFFFVFLIPLFLIGYHPLIILLAGIVLDTYQFFCHGNYLQFPRFTEYILVTPKNHRVHHSRDAHHQRSNFGAIFSIWDRLFGTYTTPNTITDTAELGVSGLPSTYGVVATQFYPAYRYLIKRTHETE